MFQLEKLTTSKLKEVKDKAIKVGQKDTRPAVIVTHETVLPNTCLEMFNIALRGIFYGKGNPGANGRKQAQIEGVDMVEDLPALTDTGQAVSTLHWDKEQTGCTLTIDYGTGGDHSNIVLREGTLMKRTKLSLLEGGAVRVTHKFHAPVDHLSAEQLGKLHLMHQRQVKVTLLGPTVDEQRDIEDPAPGAEREPVTPPAAKKGRRAGNAVTPIQALKKATRGGKSKAK